MALHKTLALSVLVLLVAALVSCAAPAEVATPTAAPVAEDPTPEAVAEEPTPEEAAVDEATPAPVDDPAPDEPDALVPWTADGVVSAGEYPHNIEVGSMRFWWRNDAEHIYFAIQGETEGWIAVGFDPENRMQGANFIIGAIQDGEPVAWDAYGTAPTGATHPPDDELGGTDDIVAFMLRHEDGVMTFEAQIPLDSGDPYDKPLAPGESYDIILAVGRSADFDAPHTFRGGGQITLDAIE